MHEKLQLREFLLGGLTTTEASELEERMFREDAFYREIEEERSALIEDYATENLTEEDATRFKEQCNKSPDLAQQVEHFLRLKGLLAQTESRREAIASSWFSWSAKWLTPILATIVGSLIIVICVQWSHNRRLALELAMKTQQAERHIATARSPVAVSQLEAVAFLSTDVVRGSQDIPHVAIAPGTALLQLQVELPRTAVTTEPWTVQLLRNGQEIWKSATILSRRAGTTTYLPIYVGAESLLDGSYMVRLAQDRSGQCEQTRYFEVSHPKK
jgi:hypothetical protein